MEIAVNIVTRVFLVALTLVFGAGMAYLTPLTYGKIPLWGTVGGIGGTVAMFGFGSAFALMDRNRSLEKVSMYVALAGGYLFAGALIYGAVLPDIFMKMR
jgi:uncharacterized membrane protein YdfJ with MMPL/SSD domain